MKSFKVTMLKFVYLQCSSTRILALLLLLLPGVLCMSEDDALVGDRSTRDASPSVPAIIISKQGINKVVPAPNLFPLYRTDPVSLPELPPPVVIPVPVPAGVPVPVHPAPHPNPEYTPTHPQPIPTKVKCRIEEVDLTAELCTPTVKKECKRTKLKTKTLKDREECLKIVRTVCKETEEEEASEVCFYEYNMEDEETEAKTAEVAYEVRCESTSQELCPPQQGYGQGYCKHIKTKVCFNEPSVSSVRKPVTVGKPVANKICENKPVQIPRVRCEEVETEQCIQLPYAQEETIDVEICRAEVGREECRETVLTLPKQICEELLEPYNDAPAYGAPAPAYGAPAPAYGAPAPAYGAPAPAYGAPAPAYGAPAPAYSG